MFLTFKMGKGGYRKLQTSLITIPGMILEESISHEHLENCIISSSQHRFVKN